MPYPEINYYWGFDTVKIINGSSITYIDHNWYEVSSDYLSVKNITNLESGSWVNDVHTYIGANYSFKEWNTSRDGTGTKYNVGATVTGQVTLYAIWEPLEVKPETMDLRDNDLLYRINLLTDAERAKIAAALTQHQDISGKADNGAIADEYDATTVYSEGDRCTKAGKYYRRKSWGADTPAAETWDATHWDEICVDDLITAEAGTRAAADTALNQDLDLLRDEIGKVVNGNTSALNISAGDFVIVKNSTITSVTDGLYTANNAVSAGTALVAADLTAQPTGAANVLNSNIANIGTAVTLCTATETTATDVTLSDSIYAYRFILFEAVNANNGCFMSQMTLPVIVASHNSGSRPYALYFYDGGIQNMVLIIYKEATKLNITCPAGYSVVVRGIK